MAKKNGHKNVPRKNRFDISKTIPKPIHNGPLLIQKYNFRGSPHLILRSTQETREGG